jgi:hypothetical protein
MTNVMTFRSYTGSMSFDPEDHIIVGRVDVGTRLMRDA